MASDTVELAPTHTFVIKLYVLECLVQSFSVGAQEWSDFEMELGQFTSVPLLPFQHKPACDLETVYTLTVVSSANGEAIQTSFKPEEEFGTHPTFISLLEQDISFTPIAEDVAEMVYSVFITGQLLTNASVQEDLEETTSPFFVTILNELFTLNTEPFIIDYISKITLSPGDTAKLVLGLVGDAQTDAYLETW